MNRSTLFWMIMILVLIAAVWFSWGNWWWLGGGLVGWVLLALLGWKVFGDPIKKD